MPIQKHTHKLKRHTYKTGNAIFFCALDCQFKISIPLALGKKSICWRCNNEFILTEYAIRLAKPHCENCHKPKKPTLITSQVEPSQVDIKFIPPTDFIPPSFSNPKTAIDTASDLRSRLSGILGRPDDDGDI